MVPLSRRRLLQVAPTLGVATVAGCGGDRSRPPSPTPPTTHRSTVDHDLFVVRNPAGETFVRYDDETPVADGERRSDDEPSYVSELLTTPADADRLSFDRGVAGVDEARRFLDDTAFDREAVYVQERPLGACRALAVSHVTTEDDSFDVEFCSPLRPADVACRVDERDVVVGLVRFPLAADDVSGYSIGGSGSCDDPRPSNRGGSP